MTAVLMFLFCVCLLQFLLLLGCFALFWSLYCTLEVTLAHVDFSELLCFGRRWAGHRAAAQRSQREQGVEEALVETGRGEELLTVVDSEANTPLLNGAQVET